MSSSILSQVTISIFIFFFTINNVSTNMEQNFESDLPNRSRKPLNKKESATRYLLDVYSTLNENNDKSSRPKRTTSKYLSLEEQELINESDTIMAFNSIGNFEESKGEQVRFNVYEDFSTRMDITQVYLKVFKDGKKSVPNNTDRYVVTAYHWIMNRSGDTISNCSANIETSASFTGWLTFNLTYCVLVPIIFTNDIKIGFFVHPKNETAEQLGMNDLGLIITNEEERKRPFLVAFLKSDNQLNINSTSFTRQLNVSSVVNNDNRTSCRRHDLYIDFAAIGWNDWVIAPSGYHSFFCAGDCKVPFTSGVSNHARVQSLLHRALPETVPEPCCVPTTLSPISVLYISGDNRVSLKNFRDMVVTECGCR